MSPIRHGFLTRRYVLSGFRQSEQARTRLTVAAGVLSLGVAASISACGSSGVHTQAGPTPTMSTPASTTTSTSSPDPTPRDRAATAAIAQVRRYEHLLDELAIDPRVPLDGLYRVATQPDVNDEIAFLNGFRQARDRQVGYSRVAAIRVDRVRLPAGQRKPASVQVSICLDVQNVRAHGPTGRSIVPKSRKPYFLTHITVVNRSYPKPSTWLVSNRTDREVATCAV